MTQEEVNEGNRLIAEFMDYKVFEKKYPRNHGIGGGIIEGPREVLLHNIKYNTSYDGLMPVVEKIEAIDGVNVRITRSTAIYFTEHFGVGEGAGAKKIAESIDGTKIENIYSAIIQFITWHNKIKL